MLLYCIQLFRVPRTLISLIEILYLCRRVGLFNGELHVEIKTFNEMPPNIFKNIDSARRSGEANFQGKFKITK